MLNNTISFQKGPYGRVEEQSRRVLVVSFSGLRGSSYKAPRLRRVVSAMEKAGFDPVVYGIPDTFAVWWRLGLMAWLQLLWLRFRVRVRLEPNKSWRTRGCKVIERAALAELEDSNVFAIYAHHRFHDLIREGSQRGVWTIVECALWSEQRKSEVKERFLQTFSVADRVVVFSDFVAKSLIDSGIPATSVARVWPIDRDSYPRKRGKSCPNNPRFIYTSVFVARKRLDIALEAWSTRSSRNEGELHIVGPVPAELEHLKEKYGAMNDVIFWGTQDPHEFYERIAGVGLQISTAEGLPRAMLEYMQHGLPVIVSEEASGGVVRNGIEGRVLEKVDVDSLARTFDEIIADYEAFWFKGSKGQQRIMNTAHSRPYDEHIVALLRDVSEHRHSGTEAEARAMTEPSSTTSVRNAN